jgi:outer membrane protein assembly factor BamD (BamD/ComL family)
MIWYKSSSRRIELAGSILLALAAAMSSFVFAAAAQQTMEDRYQKAIQSFNEAKMEDACDAFRQIEKESPGYKDVHTYLNPACDSAKRTYEQEERLYQEGLELFKQGQLDEAKQKFTQGRSLLLRHPKYRGEMDGYLKQIDTRMREEILYQQAVQMFNEGRDAEASIQFGQIEQAKGTRADDARSYLERIKQRREDAVRKKDAESDQQAFAEAARAFNEKRYLDAKARFQALIQTGSPHTVEAQSYVQRIDAALREEAVVRENAKKTVTESGKDPRQVAQQLIAEARADTSRGQHAAAVDKLKMAEILDPANHDIAPLLEAAQEMADQEPLRLGLEAYFAGNYDQAEQQLGLYVANHGRKIALAYFFRGATRASRYFLSGERDTQQRDLAVADFRALQKDARQFQPPKQYVSPKIISLYSQSTGGSSP